MENLQCGKQKRKQNNIESFKNDSNMCECLYFIPTIIDSTA